MLLRENSMDMNEYTKIITQVFSKKGWLNAPDIKSLEKIIAFGESIDDESRDMIIELMLQYKKISWNVYTNCIIKAIEKIPIDKYKGIKTFYVLPIITREDKGKPKSSPTVAYAFKSPEISEHPFFSGKEIIVNDETSLPQNITNSSTKMVILVDDFIGTGETVLTYLNETDKVKNISNNKIAFIFIAGMEAGIKILEDKHFSVFCNFTQKKGISDLSDVEKQRKFSSLMKRIEQQFEIDEKFEFGYGHSEALISLIRTPNNTFPVFWDSKHNKNAPFERK